MKVFIAGANGQIGKQLVKHLSDEQDIEVKAMLRKAEQADAFQDIGIETVVTSLEGPVDEIVKALDGCDAVVFTAGSGGHTGLDKTLLVDLDGAAKTIEAAELAGVERFVMVSAFQAHKRDNWAEELKPYYVAKHYADKILTKSSLNYTIIRPGALTNEPGTGEVSAAENLQRGSIPREDVALTIAACLKEKNTFKQSFDLVTGDTPISEALKNL